MPEVRLTPIKPLARSQAPGQIDFPPGAPDDRQLSLQIGYGQRLAVSSHPAARAAWGAAVAGCGIRMGCCVGAEVNVGLLSVLASLSSDRRGAATRNASTSFSSLESSSSFCLRTS
jgi:hypothetical protein